MHLPSQFSINHKVSNNTIFLTNVSYKDNNEWINICTDIQGSINEITTTCTITNFTNNEIEIRAAFNASLDISQEALVDLETIRVCYNDTI